MWTGWRYRAASVLGTALVTVAAVVVANYPLVQETFALVPFFGNPAPAVLSNGELHLAVWTALAVVLASMWPLYKPRPRRILDTIMLSQKRVLLAMVGLAALGYFKWSHRLPRSTLMLATVVLLALVPAWHLLVRRRPGGASRAVLVGDDPAAMEDLLAATDLPVVGYVSPPSRFAAGEEVQVEPPATADGGVEQPLGALTALGGFSRFDEVLVEHDIDTALLAFAETDRAEFFGTLDACHRHGVTAMVHREHASSVLTADGAGGELVEVDLEPWDWLDHVVKRSFDVAFAAVGLVVLSPVMAAVAVAITLDDGGPVLYSQARTAEFGETFTVYKFRSMEADAEADSGPQLSDEDAGEVDPRVTRVGRVLRQTHLDEVPQLWSILVGDMSVVGPRPERPALDDDFEIGLRRWRRRWFVKPGLTGLAQINAATGYEPEEKLRFDVEYIRKQSFWFDLKIVVRQVWAVLSDAARLVRER